MQKKYDLIIVGMGPSSIFCAYELLKNRYNKKILLVEKGHKIDDRICPRLNGNKCLKCKPICNIIGGFSGAGAFSDGKLLSYHLSPANINNNDIYIGGKDDTFIKKYYSAEDIKKFIKYTDEIYLDFGASNKLEGVRNRDKIIQLQKKSKRNGINLVDVPVRHLGTEKSHDLYRKLQEYLENKIDMLFETEVNDLIVKSNCVKGIRTNNGDILADKVVLAVGVDGSQWLEKVCKKYNINCRNGYMDIGVRFETSDIIMNEVNELLYEGKFIAKIPPYYDKVRTYCQNPSGFVTLETYDNDCTLVNGHSYKNIKSNNTNLAILVSHKISAPFDSPIEYGFNIAKNANLISGGKPIIQRFGDLINNISTTEEKLKNNKIIPTANSCYCGDLSYVLNYRTLTELINFINKMNKIIPGFNDDDNLVYGPEIKFYGKELILDNNFCTSLNNLYSIGTGGGLTVGLMMASVSGVMFARKLIEGDKDA